MVSNFDKSTYIDWVRVTAKGCILGWRNLPEHWSDSWRSLKEFAYDFQFVLFSLVLPLMTPFAPIIAWFLRREMRHQQVLEAKAARRIKDRFFRRSGDSAGGAK